MSEEEKENTSKEVVGTIINEFGKEYALFKPGEWIKRNKEEEK